MNDDFGDEPVAGAETGYPSAQLPEGGRAVVEVNGLRIAITRVDGKVWAIDDACPHRGGSLGCGDLQGYHLYCPQHAWCFDVRSGEAFFPAGARVRTYRVSERAGMIVVD